MELKTILNHIMMESHWEIAPAAAYLGSYRWLKKGGAMMAKAHTIDPPARRINPLALIL